jgi:chaperonin GroES
MKKEKIRMFRDLLLVKRIKDPEKTSGGLFIPQQVDDDKPVFWDVLEVGSKVDDVKPGDRIVTFRHTGGQEFHFNGEDLLVMRWKNVFGVME